MHLLTLVKVVGLVLVVIGAAELLPSLVSLFYGDSDWMGLLMSALGAMAIGGAMSVVGHRARELSIRDGFVVVTAVWVTACVAGAVPFLVTQPAHSFIDALFESVSGFTTTGATIESDFESLSHGILLWRSMSQWFGGMGIIVFALAILPTLGVAGMQLFEREVPGPYHDKITPRLRDTAVALWSVYLVLTAVEVLVLWALGMPLFEAVCHSMTTIATGGFGTRADSIGGFHSAAIEWTVIGFMLLGGMNFSLHYRLLTRRMTLGGYLRDVEWRTFTVATVGICVSISLYLWLNEGYAGADAVTKGTFQGVAILTTTGFASDNYAIWGAFPQFLLIFAMLTGGCAGSTSGGVKWLRVIVAGKGVYLDMLRILHPRLVANTQINESQVTERIQSNITSFLALFVGTIGILTVLISLDMNSMVDALGAAISAVANIGPALGELGPAGHYGDLSSYVKTLYMTGMLLGRLELLTVFMVFLPHTWRA